MQRRWRSPQSEGNLPLNVLNPGEARHVTSRPHSSFSIFCQETVCRFAKADSRGGGVFLG